MTTLKQGDLIKLDFTSNETTLKDNGYTWDTPAWEPEDGIGYWFIDERGNIYTSVWDNDIYDNERKNFLGIYETKELCEAAVLEIRRKLRK